MRALAQQAASELTQPAASELTQPATSAMTQPGRLGAEQPATSAMTQQAASALAQQAVSGWRTRGAAARGVDPRADEPRDYGTGVTEVNDFMRAGEDDPRQPMVSRWGGLAVGRGRVPGCR